MTDNLIRHVFKHGQGWTGAFGLQSERNNAGRDVSIAHAEDGDIAANVSRTADRSITRNQGGEREAAGQQGVGSSSGQQLGVGSWVEVLAFIELVNRSAVEGDHGNSPVRLAYRGIRENAADRLGQRHFVPRPGRRREKSA